MTQKPVLGVSACLFRADKVLLVERGRPPFQGLFSLPGGRVEFGERLHEAVAREVREETGLVVDRFAFFCLHEAIETDAHVVIAVHRASRSLGAGAQVQAGDDAASAGFVAVGDLRAMGDAGRLTSGLANVVESAYAAHLAGL